MNINDQKVIDYIESNGKLCERGEWNNYSADYEDYCGDLAQHFSEGGCTVIKGDDIEIQEARRGEFLDTFSGCKDVLVMELHGYGCACGEYGVGELGYYIKETFQEMLLNIQNINIDVNLTRYSNYWY